MTSVITVKKRGRGRPKKVFSSVEEEKAHKQAIIDKKNKKYRDKLGDEFLIRQRLRMRDLRRRKAEQEKRVLRPHRFMFSEDGRQKIIC